MSALGCIMDVKRMAIHDGPGVRTTLFLKGCPLKCIWCHNPEGIGRNPQLAYYNHKCLSCGECTRVCPAGAHTMDASGHHLNREACKECGLCETVCVGDALKFYGKMMTVQEALELVMEDRVFYGETGGVTLSGGEPLIQLDFLHDLLRTAKQEGLHTAIDTCGCVPWTSYERILPFTDMFLYDLKHIVPERHRLLTGRDNQLILDNLRALSDAGARIEVRIPLVPGCNDDEHTLLGMAEFLSQLRIERVKLLPYHALARSKYQALGMKDTMPQVPSPDSGRMQAACGLFLSRNLNAVCG